MQSLRYLYKIGHGPSSSHTMGPSKAATVMMERYPQANNFKVVLYGSLALTGKGHLTDKIIIDTFGDFPCDIKFDYLTECTYHPNTLDIYALVNDEVVGMHRFFSIGGGSIEIEGEGKYVEENIYPFKTFTETRKYLEEKNMSIPEYIVMVEGEEIKEFLHDVYIRMKNTIKSGLNKSGELPGSLHVQRKAKSIMDKFIIDGSMVLSKKIFAYAYAVSEENASGEIVVTAPTCGACGVLPSVMYGLQKEYQFPLEKIIEALMVAGFVGNIVKNNASISGAEAGCQAEIGTACAMTAAATAYLFGLNLDDIEQSAEVALEHHLGLTCDPIDGYVQIPCIERNAVCALRALDSAKLVQFMGDSEHKISFDMVCKTMLETGRDLHESYRETAEGGLAKTYRK